MQCAFCRINSGLFTSYRYRKNSYNSCYGTLLEREENLVVTCTNCLSKVTHLTEVQFCDAIGIEPITVSGKIIKRQIFSQGCCG